MTFIITAAVRHVGTVGVCGTCMDARGIRDVEFLEGTRRSTLNKLTAWTLEAGKVIMF